MHLDVDPRPYRPNDAAALTGLLNRAYRELHDSGLNFTAATQDVDTTRGRIAEGACWVVEHEGSVSATMTMSVPPPQDIQLLSDHARSPRTGWLCQVAVGPELRGRSVSQVLFETAMSWAVDEGVETIGLDTAAPATHLRTLYARWGFDEVDAVQFPGKNYASIVMTRGIFATERPQRVSE